MSNFLSEALGTVLPVAETVLNYRTQSVQASATKAQAQAQLLQAQTAAAAQAASQSTQAKVAKGAMVVAFGLAGLAMVSAMRRIWRSK